MKELLLMLLEVCQLEELDAEGDRWHEIVALEDDIGSQLDQMRVKVIG